MVPSEGFEPPQAEPVDLQSTAIDQTRRPRHMELETGIEPATI